MQASSGSKITQRLTALSIAAFAATGAFAIDARKNEKTAEAQVAAAKADKKAAAPAPAAASKR